MNHAYRLVWSATQQAWTVSSELARGKKKSAAKTLTAVATLLGTILAGNAYAVPAFNALPTGESVASGTATFDRSVVNQLTVNQSSSKLITNWNSFDVGASATVQFVQPDAGSVALNRITTGSASEIFGQVSANGQLMIVNPNGIVFGAGSQVSAASLLASVLDIADSDFENDNLFFDRNGATGSIENHGTLTATSGTVALLAPSINNTGSIVAIGGDANLMSADRVAGYGADLSQSSTIGGIIKSSGSIQASEIDSVGGRITLSGDSSDVTSKLVLGGSLTADNIDAFGRRVEVNSALALSGVSNIGADDSIYINDDINLAGNKALNFFHSSDAGQGYFLDKAARVNLGAGSTFSVNDNEYTVIQNVTQLQAMNTSLAGRYVLGSDIDASSTIDWNDGRGFAPVGSVGTRFSGILDGLGHAVNALSINRPGTDRVGLFSYGQNSTLQNIGLNNANIIGGNFTGGLLGQQASNSGNSGIRNSYVSGAVSGTGVDVGGLIGRWDVTSGATGMIDNSYSTATINSSSIAGGLVGYLSVGSGGIHSISHTYATGAVSGSSSVGGLIGTSTVSGGASDISYSYWDTTTTGRGSAVGNDAGGSRTNLVGLGSDQLKNLSSFAAWGSRIDAQGGGNSVWRIYEGQTAPLLRSFLKPLTVTGSAVSKTYDASNFTAGSYTLSNPAADSSRILGTAQYGGTAMGARNAGVYDLTVSGLYSGQQGYDLSFAGGQLTINKASLVISATDASKTYDGNTVAQATAVVADGILYGTDSLSGGTFAFDNKNAAANKHVIVSGVNVNDGNSGNNYVVSYTDNTNSSISKKLLTISAAADSKEYDGRLWSNIRPVVTGRVSGDSIAGLSQSFTDKNAGTGKTLVVDAGFVIRDGNKGNNYQVVVLDNHSGIITPKQLIISTVANSKVYDGGVTSVNKPLVTGLAYGDRITGLFQQYEDKAVGENKKLLVKAGYVLRDGNNGSNYTVTEQGSTDGVITAH